MSPQPSETPSFSERDICTKFVTPALVAAGWDLHAQIREEVTFTAGRVIVRGNYWQLMSRSPSPATPSAMLSPNPWKARNETTHNEKSLPDRWFKRSGQDHVCP
ncbi:MAG: hypothetical protein RBU21_23890 [FCB group bacterium]|jgi:hypothetical protein|nr:hypothetical protein [FCB group bacterium]